jgi:hypothetical protein
MLIRLKEDTNRRANLNPGFSKNGKISLPKMEFNFAACLLRIFTDNSSCFSVNPDPRDI